MKLFTFLLPVSLLVLYFSSVAAIETLQKSLHLFYRSVFLAVSSLRMQITDAGEAAGGAYDSTHNIV